jgi:ATP-dependent Clp protease ATP-binding subunit ClpA
MRRLIQDSIEDHLAEGVLDGTYEPGDIIKVDVAKKQLVFSKVTE